MVYLTHVYQTGRMDIEMSETPFYLKISFRGEDASRWVSYKYTIMAVIGWKISNSFGQIAMPIRDKVSKIREFITSAPILKFDASRNKIMVNISPNISIPLTQMISQPRLPDIVEESDDSWFDESLEPDPPRFIIADCKNQHIRCQDDIYEIDELMRKVRTLCEENDFLRALIFRR